jgi:general stress protein YciG
MSEIETALREHLRALGRKGAAATKRRYADDPNFYRSLGKLGGTASGVSRRAKLATRAVETSELREPDGPLQTDAPPPSTLFEILADRPDIERLSEAIRGALKPGRFNS